MFSMKRLALVSVLPLAMIQSACSSSSGTAASASGTAGFLKAPSASCSGQPCVPGSNVSLAATDAERAVAIYEAFNSEFIGHVNSIMTEVYTGMAAAGATSCDDVEIGASGTANGMSFIVTSPSKNIPAGFTKAGVSFGKRVYVAVGETPIVEIHVYCGSDTNTDPLTISVLSNRNGIKAEFIYEKNNDKIRIMGAGILPSGGRMAAWFKTDDGSDFDLEVASNVDGVTDHYQARGQVANDDYLIQESGSSSICINGAGATSTCGFSLNASPNLAVTNQTSWGTFNVSTYTIANP